jgi:hypothetical protein
MDNYRPIAITSIFSKVLELLILNKHWTPLETSDNQFGFKQTHSTDMCIFALQQVIDMYIALSSPVFICYLDASKAFDRINHWKLFNILIQRGFPKATVRLIVYWYTSQSFIIQWGNCLSDGFTVSNGVRQGGVLSPMFFNLYIDDLSRALTNSKTGCNLNNVFVNHFFYADDAVLVAPSPIALQKLIRCCEIFAKDNDIIFNTKKTVCMYIKSRKFKDLKLPTLYLYGKPLKLVETETYLGFVMSNNCTSDRAVHKQMCSLYGKGNLISSNFSHVSLGVKLQLVKSFCTNVYCGHLWGTFTKSSYTKVNVAYRRILKSFMKLDNATSISQTMLLYNINSLDVLLRKSVHNFLNRLLLSDNAIINVVTNSLFYYDSSVYKRWLKILY